MSLRERLREMAATYRLAETNAHARVMIDGETRYSDGCCDTFNVVATDLEAALSAPDETEEALRGLVKAMMLDPRKHTAVQMAERQWALQKAVAVLAALDRQEPGRCEKNTEEP